MTTTLTYKNGWYNDGDSATAWTEDETGGLVLAQASDGDVLTVSCTTDAVDADEFAFLSHAGIVGLSSTIYPSLSIRWRTAAASAECRVGYEITWSDGGGGSTGIVYLGFSTTWKVSTISIPVGHTLAAVRLYFDDYPNTIANGTYYAYIDWVLLHAGTFTFPHVAPGGVKPEFPRKIAQLSVPKRGGDIIQYMGQGTPTITVTGDVLQGEAWESGTSVPHFDYLLIATNTDVWGYFTCDYPRIRCQATIKDFYYSFDQGKATWNLVLLLYKLSSLEASVWGDWEWMYGSA